MIAFEFPLTEEVRTWLRLEAAWGRWCHFTAGDTAHDHHAALAALFECVAIAGRSDLKRHLIAALTELTAAGRGDPPVSHLATTEAAALSSQLLDLLHDQPSRLDHLVRHQPLLDALRTRTHVPGGVCGFDLPAYHYWLALPAEKRRAALVRWMKPAEPLFAALTAILAHLRAQGRAQSAEAIGGAFQQPLAGKLPRLVQVAVSAADRVIPKVAANRYQLNLHFLTITDDGTVTDRYQGPERLAFRLTLCG